MIVLGLTGPSGAGKGEISRILRMHYGAEIIDADAVYHALLIPPSPCLDALCEAFGNEILTEQGTLDRKMLGGIVFSNPEALKKLNTIAHHFVMEDVRKKFKQLRDADAPLAVLDAPQLFEAHAERDCDAVISVLADKELRARRIMARDNIDHDAAMKRINAQLTDEFFRMHSDYVIENSGTAEELLPAVRSILQSIGGIAE